MRQRKPTQHELDCRLVRSFLVAHSFKTEAAVLDAFARIERRATRTSVKGKDYVVHILEPRPSGIAITYCGRRAESVNSAARAQARDLLSEQWCKRCVARIQKEKTLR